MSSETSVAEETLARLTLSSETEAEETLARYLESCADFIPESRTVCSGCKVSQFLYCPTCYEILSPEDNWPESVVNGTFRLPFDLDIVLDDKRNSATSIQLATMIKKVDSPARDSVVVYDCEQNDEIPKYEEGSEGTYLLFPGPSSQPLSSVLSTSGIKKLVVLDCKWSRPSIRLNPSVASLKTVHLDHAPKQSFFWRAHSEGEGMVCTIEAIYFAAWQAAGTLGWPKAEQHSLVHMMWLFGQQREVIRRRYAANSAGKLPNRLPFTEEAKDYQRSLWRKNARQGRTPAEDVPGDSARSATHTI
jgi:hypothetical protein